MRSTILPLTALLFAGTLAAQVQTSRAPLAPDAISLAPPSTIRPMDIEDPLPEFVRRRTDEFMGINLGTVEFDGKVPFAVQPIYSYGVDGVAYYEVWLTEDGRNAKGWLLLSATDTDYPLVNFSHDGTPYSQKVLRNAQERGSSVKDGDRIFRFGVSYFTIESPQGLRLGDYGEMPNSLPGPVALKGGGQSGRNAVATQHGSDVEPEAWVHYIPVTSYDDLRTYFAGSYFTPRRAEFSEMMRVRLFPESGHGEAFEGGASPAGYNYRWIDNYNNQALYTQIRPNYWFNFKNCWSGCSNNAWANVFAWWDKNRGKANLVPTTVTGETCPTFRNTWARQQVADPIQMWLSNRCSTYCDDGGGATSVNRVWRGVDYAPNRGYGYSYRYQWCNSPGCHAALANIAIQCIWNYHRPLHFGANSHAYVGTGLAQWSGNTDWTFVYGYPGWSEDHTDDVWIWWADMVTSTRVLVY